MRLAIVGSVGVPASYGGFETLVEHLIEDESFEYTVYCSGKHYRSKRLETYKAARLVYLPLNANGVSSIFYDVCSVLHGIATGHQIFLILNYQATFYSQIKIVKYKIDTILQLYRKIIS